MIYPLNQQIENLMCSFVDEETGELKYSEEEMNELIADLEMSFEDKILGLRNSYLDLELAAKSVAADAKTLRDEATIAQRRANSIQNRADRIKRFIAYLLQGEKFDKGGALITYRKSEECVLDDSFTEWAISNAPELLKWEPSKSDVKEAIKSGLYEDIPAHIEERRNIQIK